MKFFSLIILLWFATVPLGIAQKRAATAKVPPEIQTLKTMAYLTRYGHTHQDGLSFIQAARLLAKQPVEVIPNNQIEISLSDTSARLRQHPFMLNADTLLAWGRRLSQNNTAALTLADQVDWELGLRSRGRTEGPKTMAAQVKGGSSFATTWSFKGSEKAIVSVIGDGDNDLDLFVFDKHNNIIAQDDSHTDACEVQFTPSNKADYKIVVKNWGSSYSDFILITN
ncbi:hypothetical protein SAMN05444682_110134 [Parapedobacter indicus]|uniref:Pre-peptidase C-terminal domain-containing protein n=2 Tax=Parapedobacter indicus TaxID=1477437 RepID=A0A1I3RX34_9SPHI|nr:hypothetical protein [Parapedobacter indicus]PPK99980.1 hypothetical protein CLV26_110111 [Parapedobacter indicus]SFJ49836.1 hypothetical protein SAMN05444682_110134 [Parapedobacter indicus]